MGHGIDQCYQHLQEKSETCTYMTKEPDVVLHVLVLFVLFSISKNTRVFQVFSLVLLLAHVSTICQVSGAIPESVHHYIKNLILSLQGWP